MKDEFKDLGYVKRLATKEEIKQMFDFLIKTMWESQVLYANSLGAEAVSKGFDAYYKETLFYFEQCIGDLVLVDEFKKYDALMFTYSQVLFGSEVKEPCTCYSGRIFKIKDYFEELDAEEVMIDFLAEIAQKKSKSGSKNKVGRPDRPEEESILKTHKVRIELLSTKKNVDDVCKEFNIAKSTYYRVSKWLSKNTINNIMDNKKSINTLVVVFLVAFFFTGFKEVKKNLQLGVGNLKKESLKAVVIDKKALSNEDFIIILKSLDGKIFTIDNALQYWDNGKIGDTISICYAKDLKPNYLP